MSAVEQSSKDFRRVGNPRQRGSRDGCACDQPVGVSDRFMVEDSGIGFDAGSAERIFDSMFTSKEGGMGMGLRSERSG